MTEEYYVYMYLREDGTPYHVGEGKGKRAYDKSKRIKVPPKDRIVLVLQNLTEEQSFSNERDFIAWYGRKDNSTGILRNLTDGGDGTSGRKLSEETKNKMRNSTKGFTPEAREKIRIALTGYKQSQATKDKRRHTMLERFGGAYNKGISPSDEVRAKISKGLTGKKQSQSTIEKRLLLVRGQKRSEEFCKRMSDSRKGIIKVKYNVELIDSIISDCNTGVSKSELQRKYGINRGRIIKIIKNPHEYTVQ